MKRHFKILFEKNIYLSLLILIFICTNSTAQEFPIKDFMKVYINQEKYSLKNYQIDTTIKSKKDFLNKLNLNFSDTLTGFDIFSLLKLNGVELPEEILITDLNKDGKKEYFITDNYEGILHYNYIEEKHNYVSFLDTTVYQQFRKKNNVQLDY